MAEQKKGFWTSLPGILTGIAAVITAATGFYAAVNGNSSEPLPTPGTSTPVSGTPTPVPPPKTVKPAEPVNRPDVVPPSANKAVAKKPFPETGPLVDCSLFPTVNTVDSLMSWSNHYHQQIVAAGDSVRGAAAACNQTIDYRGMAHCKDQNNVQVRGALLETLQLCRAVGFEWEEIQHSTILGKE